MKITRFLAGLILALFFVVDASAVGACMRKRIAAASESGNIPPHVDSARTALDMPALKSADEVAANSTSAKAIAEAPASPADQKLIALNSSSGAAAADEVLGKVIDIPVAPKEITWTLDGGKSIRTQLIQWAEVAGWRLDWKVGVDWMVPSSITYSGTFDHALETVVEQLYAQGKPVRLLIWNGNQVAEVVGSDVK